MSNAFYIGVNPVIFNVGPIVIGWYGTMVVLAVVTVVAWLFWQNSRNKVFEIENLLTIALVGIISGMIGSKVAHVIDQFGYYRLNPSQIFSSQGFAIWGAVLGAAIGIWVYSRISQNFNFSLFVDMLAPGIILAQAVGRVGCTLNGCCYGIVSYSPLAVIYTNPNSSAPLGIPVLPTQVFEVFYDLIVFGILYALRGKLRPSGSLFCVYLALYAAWRFGIDFIREGTPIILGLHEAQIIGMAVLLITLPLIVFTTRAAMKQLLG